MTSMILKRWPSSLYRVIPDRRICVDADGLPPPANIRRASGAKNNDFAIY
jgi:hypothetical protein